MAFTKIADISAAKVSGKILRISFNKKVGAAAYTAGRWYNTYTLAGQPYQGTYTGSLAATQFTSSSDGAMQIGAATSPFIRHLSRLEIQGMAATAVPSWLMLVDFLMYYNAIDMNSLAQQPLTNVATLPRYTDGNGVQMFLAATATTGATLHNLHSSGFTYTNTTPTSGRTIPGTVTCLPSAIVPHIVHSGVATSNHGPFIPLAAGDLGVKSVENFQLTAASGSASTACLILCKPLFYIPLLISTATTYRDAVFNIPSLPVVYDDACLGFLIFTGANLAATTNIFGAVEFVWG